MFKKLDEILAKYQTLKKLLHSVDASSSLTNQVELMKEFSSLGKIVEVYEEYQEIIKNIQTYEKILSEGKEEKDILILTKEECEFLKIKEENLLQKLKQFLVPSDPLDDKNVIVEVRPAAGGDEASLFCEDLFTMYSYYANQRKWRVEIMSSLSGNSGGFKEIIFSISGVDVYKDLKYESGVHRVQRVPKTETQGRVHTSTVTVVILPEADALSVKINPSDIRVDTFRSSGAGGQHVNTTDSAIRVVHVPTKTVVQCQDEKSQHANKEKALKVLYARLYDLEMKKKKQKESQERLSIIGTGDRSEKIRTYNFPQSRITDHRINLTVYNLDQFIGGDIGSLIEALKASRTEQYLAAEGL